MRKLFLSALVLAVLAAGCALTDYPVILDSRGDYSGIIRTGHKAYVVPTSQVATIFDDGSDELFTMVYQNQFGDQKLYTFNNFDPTASVLFLDQTYCDWRYSGCEITRAWNPHQDQIDDIFDYEFFPDCSGARSLSMLVSQTSRVGECGDVFDPQALASEFAALPQTTFRGEPAYVMAINSANTLLTLNDQSVPIFGQFNAVVTDQLNTVFPMTPNARHELAWLNNYIATNGTGATVAVTYGSVTDTFNVTFAASGIAYNLDRF